MRRSLPRFPLPAAALAAAALLAGCSGSNAVQVVGTGGTGMPQVAPIVAQGPITGFGSLIVNGHRFDESGATVTINGVENRPVSELGLGMTVVVRGELAEGAAVATAKSVVATAVTVGGLQSVDLASGTLAVSGQTVRVGPGTALQGASSLAGLKAGDALTVYGLRNPLTAAIDATRLELVPPGTVVTTRILGMVAALSGTRFRLADQEVESAGATLVNLPGGLANGRFVEVEGPLPAPGATLAATRIEGRSQLDLADGARVEIEDFITDFAGTASFRVLGAPVNAANAIVTGGTAASLANGVRVEIEGTVAGGVIAAALVEIRALPTQLPPETPIAVEGTISDFVGPASFRVREQVIDASGAAYTGGTAAELANGRLVRAAGVQRGTTLVAATLAFLAPPEPEGTPLAVSGAITDFSSPASFRVNGQAVTTNANTAFVDGTAASLANGRIVDVEGRAVSGVLVAAVVAFRPDPPPPPQPQPVELRGVITDFASATSFRVNNQPITTTAQTTYDDGRASDLANGREVKVTGTLLAGLVTATRIEFESSGGEQAEVEGAISAYVSIANFTVKGQVIDASAAVFENGSPAKLAVGRKVHVKGPVAGGVLKAATLSMEL